MSNFHGTYKRRSYFEGWYFKNQSESEVISLIPAFHVDEQGRKSVSIQVVTNMDSYHITYPIDDFAISRNKLGIRIGKSIFTSKGMILNIESEQITVKGKLTFGEFIPLKYDIMGPFRYLPFMQCRHSVFSLAHDVIGKLIVNGKEISFHKGMGYVEGDRGVEFPSDYLWTQCSFRSYANNAIMISVAHIPFGKFSFMGCIGVVYYGGKEYRFATYKGVKVREYTRNELWVQQGRYDLQVTLLEENPHHLLAPVKGNMKRTVFESIHCRIRYRFMIDRNVVFDFIGKGSFERGM